MNVDIITTFLNDFATFWKNIWNFLKPIFNLIAGGDKFGPVGEENDANNWQNVIDAFNPKTEVPEVEAPTEEATN